ncbi:glucose-methanol-choline oxidoreductase [Sphingomonas sp. Leaf407]|uniref:GMC family oxidoreductase n=1 Tax=unclassified Sphingomonas TaxID=196159 RepID=UPI0006F8EA27|nr:MULTISPECIES: GMC family oxidoreductase N-terminal domain-containing protein [unclassified Sphingomonas]KQN36497.1 glucose-methanol-choline oxidoreductase [Sphingomonas sp. Leaf42]KQT27118.1 glucose-methanol-choline oxidoreductase [Sphingomonas sp. Leaf407]
MIPDEADIVVIGAGSGGSAVAGRLSERTDLTVALLEAGGRNDDWRTRMPSMVAAPPRAARYSWRSVPQPGLNGRRSYQPRGKGLGGSSAVSAMLYVRGHAGDYDGWAALGCPGWSHDDVLPWFRASEANTRGSDAWHGDAGPLPVADQRDPDPDTAAFLAAAAQAGLPANPDFNGRHQDGAGLYQVTQARGERWSAARAYLTPRANLSIGTDALVERILFEDGRAWGVAYRHGGRRRILRARGGVVLAGGAFATPQLLMLSGLGPARHLADHGIPLLRDRPAIGSDLQDHLDYSACFTTAAPHFRRGTPPGRIAAAHALLRWATTGRGPGTTPYAEAGAFLRTAPGAAVPDIQLHFVVAPIEDHGRTRIASHGFACRACLLRPDSRGTVRLATRDAAAMPLIDPAYLSAPADLPRLMAGVRAMYRILHAPALAALGGQDRWPFDDATTLEALVRARADTLYHPVGTARMGSDAAAVCDPQLAVRGVERLWIADASVMPRIIGGNTNAATIMIGERAADWIARALR